MSWNDSLRDALDRTNSPFIAGEFVGAASAGATTHIDPSTGQAVGVAHVGGAREIDQAISSAAAAQRQWIASPSSERATVVLRFADLIQRDAELLRNVLAIDAGVPASMEVEMATGWVRHFAGWADKITVWLPKRPAVAACITRAVNLTASSAS